jgi:malate dehydrogenase (oxaloacetate-decarboxylating)(NADP+)
VKSSKTRTVLFLGAGEAATGIADLISASMVAQGLTEEAARNRCWLVDSRGLVVKSRTDLAEHKLLYAHDHAPVTDFLTAIRELKPTAIIGVAAVGGTFTKEVLEEMARINKRPIIFALIEPDFKIGVHGGGGVPSHRWTRAFCVRQSVQPRDA